MCPTALDFVAVVECKAELWKNSTRSLTAKKSVTNVCTCFVSFTVSKHLNQFHI